MVCELRFLFLLWALQMLGVDLTLEQGQSQVLGDYRVKKLTTVLSISHSFSF